VCDCNMEEGSLRCDANISVRPKGETRLGTKVELKNMNSFRSLEKALDYEAARQIETVRSGGAVEQETYLWNAAEGRSEPMRSKEDAHDYRYFPDPDLVPLLVDKARIDSLRTTLPELPSARRQRFEKEIGCTADAAEVLTSSKPLADYYEAVLAAGADARLAANWVMVEILRMVNELKIEPCGLRVTPRRLAALLAEVSKGAVSAQAAKRVLEAVQSEDREPVEVIAEKGLAQISDAAALEAAVRKVLAGNPGEAARFRAGEKKLAGFFVGQAMKATGGKGNPREIHAIVERLLG
jgi:aspartyl-tRNA(Asn)/glutamyl-tRNA(Gln) amidotransferase subunit B